MPNKSCRCNCGYTCRRACGLKLYECMEKHYKTDCDHKWDGDAVEFDNGWSVTCRHCGMTAIGHDSMVGP